MATTEETLLAGMVARPREVDGWLVLADWLEDQDDPRAELARLRYQLLTEPDHPDRCARAARQQELLEEGLAPLMPTWTNPLGMRFALVHPGTFWMGSPENEPERLNDEVHHRVTLTEPYFLGAHTVTLGQFRQFIAATSYQTEAEQGAGGWGYMGTNWVQNASITWRNPGFKQNARHPAVCLSWNDATAFLNWLNEVEADTGRVYSFPTEAQWEYAARAGTETAFFWGNDARRLGEYAWFEPNAKRRTHAVETKKPNPWGLWHMHGHLWEWCGDHYSGYLTDPVTDPEGGSGGTSRVLRGGSWGREPRSGRSACRRADDPTLRLTTFGLRLALAIPAS
jgi:uncharacterized protein (TIGR02996 family)